MAITSQSCTMSSPCNLSPSLSPPQLSDMLHMGMCMREIYGNALLFLHLQYKSHVKNSSSIYNSHVKEDFWIKSVTYTPENTVLDRLCGHPILG